jgi:hypothetical protein
MQKTPYENYLTTNDILLDLCIKEDLFLELFKTPEPPKPVSFQTKVALELPTPDQIKIRNHRTCFPDPIKNIMGTPLWTSEQLRSWRQLNF